MTLLRNALVQGNDLLLVHGKGTQSQAGEPLIPRICPPIPGKSCQHSQPREESQCSFLGWRLQGLGCLDQSYKCQHLCLHLQGDQYCLAGSKIWNKGKKDSLQAPWLATAPCPCCTHCLGTWTVTHWGWLGRSPPALSPNCGATVRKSRGSQAPSGKKGKMLASVDLSVLNVTAPSGDIPVS